MIRTVLSLLFFIGFLVNGNLIAQSCSGEAVEIGGADGSFESCASIAASNIPGNITCGGWFNGQGSADAREGGNNVMSTPESPDGGVFAALWVPSINSPSAESFYTDVDNLTIGKDYTLKFYFVNTGMYSLTPFPGDAKLEVTFGSEVKETSVYSFDGYGSQVWDEITMKFTAASTSQRLTFHGSRC